MSSKCIFRLLKSRLVSSLILLTFAVVPAFGKQMIPSRELFDEERGFGTLVLSNVIYRHGDRTPVECYPLDPYKNSTYWPEGLGQLTNKGKEQHYELGKWLRQRYEKLLPSAYSKQDIFVRSTDVDRTLMSAESNLAGLYPPNNAEQWNVDVNWQPIPVHTTPEQMDELLAAKKPCARYSAALEKAKNSPAMQELNKKYAPLYQYLSVHSGKDISDISGVEFLYNTLYIENLYNLTLPEWTKSVFPKKMASVAALSFTVPALTSELQRFKSGPLLGEIIHHMKQKIDKKLSPDRKMFMYSAHDTTVANFLMTLKVFDIQSPPYTATILVELWLKNQNYVVTVMYRNSTDPPYLLTLPGCETVCPYEHFLKITQPVIPINWEAECSMTSFFESNPLEDYSMIMIGSILFGVFLITLAMCIVMTLASFRKNRSHVRYERLSTGASSPDKFQTA